MSTATFGGEDSRYVLRVDLPARSPVDVGLRVDHLLRRFTDELAEALPGLQPSVERILLPAAAGPSAPLPRSRPEIPVLAIDVDARRVFVGDRLVQLAHKEFEILRQLVARPGEVVTREEIVAGFGDGSRPAPRTVDVHVHRIRAKLELCGDCISTVRGNGYRFNESSSVVVS
ncbi:winged helix-turn-helix domain-containing protein [Nocardioides yefusunii]|uniref:Winged helix-turn-helix domain-containing protein n=1 Tax=Nocardioides yefusunii TaxID=2500546 RepID=A0ABW1R3T2_9ACTN|nr:winged helix-turn-helix domain-containing protein [Nocardioides yefusunii]